MDFLALCRLCTGDTDIINSTNLFDRKSCLLGQIKDVTGCSLRNTKNLPPYICLECEHHVSLAHQFRKRCMESQLYFCSAKYKEKLKKQSNNDEQDPTDSELRPESLTTDFTIRTDLKSKVENIANLSSLEYEGEEQENDAIDEDSDIIFSIPLHDLHKSENKIRNPRKRTKLKTSNVLNAKSKRLAMSKSKGVAGGKLDLICDQCGNHFTCRHHFKTHLRRHTNDKPFQCEVCPNKFFTHSELKRHMRRHTGEKPFACKHCQRRFTDYSTRIKHERIHTNERPFACTQCDKKFTTSYVLKNHMLIHTGERLFRCSLCSKAFQRQTHLTVHYRSSMHKQNVERRDRNMKSFDENYKNN